jgi:putative transposase
MASGTGTATTARAILFGVLNDRSRLACHLQWYLAETAEVIAHAISAATAMISA